MEGWDIMNVLPRAVRCIVYVCNALRDFCNCNGNLKIFVMVIENVVILTCNL